MEEPNQPDAEAEDKRTDSDAVRIVIELERHLGHEPRDVRKQKGAVADIESRGRLIEVKGFGGPFKPVHGSLLFTPPQMQHAEKNDAYFVYLVENMKHDDPAKIEVRVLHGEQLRKLVTDPGVQVQRYKVPLRRADYDGLPRLED